MTICGQKYAGRKIDLVITVWDPALSYALEHRQELFPDAPILAMVTRPRTFASDANIAQVTAGDHFLDTANLALKLHPDTRRIAVVDGSPQSNRRCPDGDCAPARSTLTAGWR